MPRLYQMRGLPGTWGRPLRLWNGLTDSTPMPARSLSAVAAAAAAVAIVGAVLLSAPRARELWDQGTAADPPVLVIVLADPERVADVHKAVQRTRVIAYNRHGFAVQGRRIMSVSLETVGELLMEAGWEDERLEIYDLKALKGARLGTRPSAPANNKIAELMNKPTLTMVEAWALLDAI